jgi:hypothetical protein
MDALLRLVGLWGLADGLWMAVAPARWSGFWGYWVGRIGQGGLLPRAVATAQIAISAYLLMRERGR